MTTTPDLVRYIHETLQARWDDPDTPDPTLEDEAFIAAAAAVVFLRDLWHVEQIPTLTRALLDVCSQSFDRFGFDALALPSVRSALGEDRTREMRRVWHDARRTVDVER